MSLRFHCVVSTNNLGVGMRELTSWSYSKYSCYKLCPAQFKYKYIERIPQGPAPALERGLEIHDDAEKFMKGKLKKIPESILLHFQF